MKSFSETLAENELQQLKQENAALREALQQSEDRFRNIPDEVWSKADLVEMTNKALEERDDADKQNAALREVLTKADVIAEHSRFDGRREWRVIECWVYPNDVIVRMDRAAFDAARAKEAKP